MRSDATGGSDRVDADFHTSCSCLKSSKLIRLAPRAPDCWARGLGLPHFSRRFVTQAFWRKPKQGFTPGKGRLPDELYGELNLSWIRRSLGQQTSTAIHRAVAI